MLKSNFKKVKCLKINFLVKKSTLHVSKQLLTLKQIELQSLVSDPFMIFSLTHHTSHIYIQGVIIYRKLIYGNTSNNYVENEFDLEQFKNKDAAIEIYMSSLEEKINENRDTKRQI